MIGSDVGKFSRSTSYENCLLPLLHELNWRGSMRRVKESMPHLTKIINITQFNDVMRQLNFEHSQLEIELDDFDDRFMPCLMRTEGDELMLLKKREGNLIHVFDGLSNHERIIEFRNIKTTKNKVTLYLYKKIQIKPREAKKISWVKQLYRENKGLIYNSLFLSMILTLLAMSAPIFIMSVYDSVIGASSYTMLSEFSAGVFLAMIATYIIYRLRAEHLALLGARCDKVIGNKIVYQLLYLSPTFTESATAGSQVARIKDFDRVREAISGPMLTVFFDMPFIVITLSVIGMLGGKLIFVPIFMIVVYIIYAVVMTNKVQKRVAETSQTFAELQEFLIESIDNLRLIKYTASVKTWEERYRNYSAKANLTNIRFSMYNAANVASSEAIMIISGMLVLALGAIEAMNEEIAVGALLAMMILIWRVLSPIRNIFNTLPKVIQLMSSVKQIDRLLELAPETIAIKRVKKGKIEFKGEVTFKNVSMRYPGAYTPSLLGVSFTIKAGQFVAVVGRNGSGKSTLLKVLMGLYQPQAGGVLIDNHDIRQINALDLRGSIGYLPQQPELFYGSVAANLRLGDPAATEEQLRIAASNAGILEDIIKMPEGFNTRLTDQSTQVMPSSFRQCLCLARAYLRNSSILLLDEPGNSLDITADKKLMAYLKKINGKITVLMVTHRPSHLSQADHIILLEQGQIALQGAPKDILEKIPLEYL